MDTDDRNRAETADQTADETAKQAIERVMRGLRPGIEVVDGVAIARFDPQPEHRGRPGWLHGGLAAAVLDHVCAGTATAVLGRSVVTGTLDLRYPRPVPLDNGPYRVEARPARQVRPTTQARFVRVEGAIIDPGGRPLVEARGLFVAIEG